MNVSYILIFTQSFFEVLFFLAIISTLNTNAKLGLAKSIIYIACLATLSLFSDINNTPYHFIISIIASVALFVVLKKPARKLIGNYVIDILVSLVILTVIQFLITSIASIFSINLIQNDIAILAILVGLIVLFKWLSSMIIIHIFFEKFYIPYRMTILFAIISVLFLMTIVMDMVLHTEELLSPNGSVSINLLVIGYFILNLFFIVIMYRAKDATDKSNTITGYSNHLQDIVNEYRASSHDLKHHLQIILNLNVNRDGSVINDELDKYLKSLIYDNNAAGDITIIKDDILISALLLQKKEYAKQKKIDFKVNMMNLIANYLDYISHSELIEILSNLIDNAFEEVEKLDIENRIVQLDFTDYYIEIRNKVSFSFISNSANQTQRIFEQGYSTKDSGRGFGLSNVLSIAKRNNIEIKQKLDDGFIIFRLEFSIKNK